MARYGMLYKIRPESIDEYEKAHAEMWPEMEELVKNAGFKNYTIFARKNGTLFAFWEHDNIEEGFKIMNSSEVRPKWEKYMDQYFVKEDKSILGPEYEELREVWHLD